MKKMMTIWRISNNLIKINKIKLCQNNKKIRYNLKKIRKIKINKMNVMKMRKTFPLKKMKILKVKKVAAKMMILMK